MWSTGYRIAESLPELQADAVRADSDFVRAFAEAARELRMAIGVTFWRRMNRCRAIPVRF